MNEPSQPPTDTLQHHHGPTLSSPFTGPWDFNPEREHLLDVIIENAVQRVLFALNEVRFYTEYKAFQFALDNLAPTLSKEYHKLFLQAESVGTFHTILEKCVAGRVGNHIPTKLNTLEEMLQQALTDSGFCCENAADDFVYEMGGKYQKEIPADWLTIDGARDAHSVIRSVLRGHQAPPYPPRAGGT